MKVKEVFSKWGLSKISLNLKFAELEFVPNKGDETAAWEMYVELVTRIMTQELLDDTGVEEAGLDSAYKMFDITREILKLHGRNCEVFAKVAIVVLNQVIRPFTAKWHKRKSDGNLESAEEKQIFREELMILQKDLRNYSKLLAEMAKVEDLTDIV